MRSTTEAIAQDLTEEGLILGYRNEEGLNAAGSAVKEGIFVICSFWLDSCLAKAGGGRAGREALRPAHRLRQRPRPAGGGDRQGEGDDEDE